MLLLTSFTDEEPGAGGMLDNLLKVMWLEKGGRQGAGPQESDASAQGLDLMFTTESVSCYTVPKVLNESRD